MKPFFYLLFSLLAMPLWAQPPVVFNYAHYPLGNGSEQSRIRKLVQGPDGKLWLSTFNAVYSFNGSQYLRCENPDPQPKTIEGLFAGPNGSLWYSCMPEVWGQVNTQSYALEMLHKTYGNSPHFIRTMYLDRKNRFWLASGFEPKPENNALYLLDTKTQTTKAYTFAQGDSEAEKEWNKVQRVFDAPSGNLWVCTYGGMVWYNPENNEQKRYVPPILFNRPHNGDKVAEFVAQVNDTQVYMGGYSNGLWRLNPKTEKWKLIFPKSFEDRGSRSLRKMLPLNENQWLVATWDSGLYVLNTLTDTYTRPKGRGGDVDAVFTQGITDMIALANGSIALATFNQGLVILSPSYQNTFYHFRNKNEPMLHLSKVVPLSKNEALFLYDHSLFVAVYNHKTGKTTRIPFPDNTEEHVDIMALMKGENGLRIITGVGVYTFAENRLQKEQTKPYKPALRLLLKPDGKNHNPDLTNQWLVKNDSLFWINTSLEIVKSYDLSPFTKGEFPQQKAPFVVVDNRYYYHSTSKGLILKLDLETGKAIYGRAKTRMSLTAFFPDGDKLLVAGFGGLHFFTEKKDSLYLDTDQGYKNHSSIIGLFWGGQKLDAHRYLLRSSTGLAIFDWKKRTQIELAEVSGQRIMFVAFDPYNEALLTIWPLGLVRIPSTSWQIKKEQVRFAIDRLMINNKLVFPENDKTYNYKNNNFNFSFELIDYNPKSAYTYSYFLEGYDADTQTAFFGKEAGYTNLNPGTYTFTAWAQNPQNGIKTASQSITFTISPPFWRTWWFWTLSVLLVSGLAFYIIFNRIQNIRKKAQLEREILEQNMISLRARMNPHFIFNSLNSINHFIISSDPVNASDYLVKFARLIRKVLENSSSSFISLENELNTLGLYVEMENMRLKNKINFAINVGKDISLNDIMVQPLCFQPFVENAIWHGLSWNEVSDARLIIDIEKQGAVLLVHIEDNGIGRKNAASMQQSKGHHHESVGIQLAFDRIKLIDPKAIMNYQDVEPSNEKRPGTRVTLKVNIQ